jgi:hypothetical protein
MSKFKKFLCGFSITIGVCVAMVVIVWLFFQCISLFEMIGKGMGFTDPSLFGFLSSLFLLIGITCGIFFALDDGDGGM